MCIITIFDAIPDKDVKRMDTHCYDILDIPNLGGIKLAAGSDGLSNIIYWVHIAEAASSIGEVFDWLKPGDFLIITGMFLKGKEDILPRLIEMAAGNRLSGILLYRSDYCEYPSDDAVKKADQYSFNMMKNMKEILWIFSTAISAADAILRRPQRQRFFIGIP